MRRILGIGYEIFDGIVSHVDESSNMISVDLDEGITMPDVLLRAASDDDSTGVIMIPTIGSYVVFAQVRGEHDYVLIKTTKLDKVIVDVAIKLVLNAPETVFNEGNNGGIPIASNVSDRLNVVEKALNDMKQILSSWSPVPNDGGAALKGAIAGWASNKITQTKPDDIENIKIKH